MEKNFTDREFEAQVRSNLQYYLKDAGVKLSFLHSDTTFVVYKFNPNTCNKDILDYKFDDSEDEATTKMLVYGTWVKASLCKDTILVTFK